MTAEELASATYDTDFYLWTQKQAALLQQGQLQAVDVANLAEEIESMGRSDKRALRSYLSIIVQHLLKWQYQPGLRGSSWKSSINNGREQVGWILKESPSLTSQLPILLADAYPLARRNASAETGLPLSTFPNQCPFTVEQVLDAEYWPD